MKTKTPKPKPMTCIVPSQIGDRSLIEIPAAAILYHTGLVSISQEDKIDDRIEALCDKFEHTILN